jgi:C_GCAxxG_C_C family probable redox protein
MQAKEVEQAVYKQMTQGYHCAEAVVLAVLQAMDKEPRPGVIKAASALGGGMAGSKEDICGAFSGGLMALGCLMGRENPGEEMRQMGIVAADYKEHLLAEFGTLNCGQLLEGFHQSGESHMGCARISARSAAILHDVVIGREASAPSVPQAGCGCEEPRTTVPLGSCPFSSGC